MARSWRDLGIEAKKLRARLLRIVFSPICAIAPTSQHSHEVRKICAPAVARLARLITSPDIRAGSFQYKTRVDRRATTSIGPFHTVPREAMEGGKEASNGRRRCHVRLA